MEWTALLATLFGAAIATGSSVLVETRKNRHDLAVDWSKTKREVYVAFITALTQVRSELLALSKRSGMTEAERDEVARQVFARCYELRYQLELCAPGEVVQRALTYFRTVRSLRNLVAAGKGVSDAEWESNTRQAKRMLDALHEAMRADLRSG